MKPIVVKYRQEIQLYNLEDDYPVSCLLLDICTDLDICPARVAFTTTTGESLPDEGVLSDIHNFKSSKLIHVLVVDKPGVDDYHDVDHEIAEKDAQISISLPSHKEIKRNLDAKDTMASLIGELILKDLIDLNIDVFLQARDVKKEKKFLIRPRSQSEKMKYGHDPIVQDVNVAEGDQLNIVDRTASQQNEELFQADVMLDLENFEILKKCCINSSDTISQTLGSLLSSGRLGTKVSLSFEENGDTDEEGTTTSSRTTQSNNQIVFNSSSEKKTSFIKHFSIEDGDKLFLTTEQVDSASVEDEEFLAEDFVGITCHGYVQGNWISWDLTISRDDRVSELVKDLMEVRMCKDIQSIVVDGLTITEPECSLLADSRLLIDDCGVKRKSVIIVKTSSCDSIAVKVIRRDWRSKDDEATSLELPIDATGRTMKQKIRRKFGLAESVSLLYQLGRRELSESSVDMQVWGADDKIQWMNLETKSVSTTVAETQETMKLMRIINDDDMLLFTGGYKPVLYFVADVRYYHCPTDEDKEFQKIQSGSNPWTDRKYLMHLSGIRIRDAMNDSTTRFLFGSGGSFCDVKSTRILKRDQVAKSKEISIPVENREINYFYLFVEHNTLRRALNIPPFKVRIWSRDGVKLDYDDGRLICRGRVCEDSFQWCRQFSGISEVERTIFHDSRNVSS